MTLGCSHSQAPDDSPDVMSGTFELIMETDSMDNGFSVELLTAIDSAVYGYIESEEADYEAPNGLDSLTTDSLCFRTYTHHLALSRSDSVMNRRILLKTYGADSIPLISAKLEHHIQNIKS